MVTRATRPPGYCYVDGVKKGLSELRIAKVGSLPAIDFPIFLPSNDIRVRRTLLKIFLHTFYRVSQDVTQSTYTFKLHLFATLELL